jgi:phosphatidylglycerophosphatase A
VPISAATLLVAFVLHRLMDIVKPWPIYVVERLPGGWGIMADDLLAAIYANVVLQAVRAQGWL